MHGGLTHAPGVLIGKGYRARVYAWGEGRVLKLFESGFPATKVEREFDITRSVHRAGLPVPAAHERVDVDGCPGIVLDLIDGPSMYEHVVARPWKIFSAARQLAELHARLHSVAAPAPLPTQRQQIEDWIEKAADFSAAEKEEARRCLAGLPQGDALCHGDFHPANILLSARGPIIIDWSRGTRGDPIGDVARTSNLIRAANLPDDAPRHIALLFKFTRAALHATYLKHYFQLRPGGREDLPGWEPIQRAAMSAAGNKRSERG